MNTSKPLGHDDTSGFEFAKEMLDGDVTAAVNFDRLQYHPQRGYIIFEYLLCEEEQQNVTPHSSHPRYYWEKNKMKFLKLWKAATDLNATLYLVNYAKAGTKGENEVRLIEVLGMNSKGITLENITHYTRGEFQTWFRALNRECLREDAMLPVDNAANQTTGGLLCPKCSGSVKKSKTGIYYCENGSRCGMIIGKYYADTLSEEQVMNLLHNRPTAHTDSKGNQVILYPQLVGPRLSQNGNFYYNWRAVRQRNGWQTAQ